LAATRSLIPASPRQRRRSNAWGTTPENLDTAFAEDDHPWISTRNALLLGWLLVGGAFSVRRRKAAAG
jgi:MYXO-CTERM domain-containing protein